jgi:hypothetical protein
MAPRYDMLAPAPARNGHATRTLYNGTDQANRGLALASPVPGPYPISSAGGELPIPSRGILAWLRALPGRFKGWMGPAASAGTVQEKALTWEQAKAGPAGIVFPWFWPYIDEITGETSEMRYWYRRMLADPHIKAALCGKIQAVGALDLRIRPPDKTRRNKTDRKADAVITEFVRWNLTERLAGGVPGLIWSVLSGGLVDGYSVSEKVWQRHDKGEFGGKIVLDQVKPKDVGNDLVLQTDHYRNVVSILGLRYNPGVTFHPSKFLLFRNMPWYESPTGQSDFRAVYGAFWFRDVCRKLRGIGATSRALPPIIGQWAHPSQQTQLEKVVADLKTSNWAVIPDNVKIQALEIAGSSESYFRQWDEDLSKEIWVGLQGAFLQALEGQQGGERGSSQVHRSTAELWTWFLSEVIVSLLTNYNSGLIRDMVDLNYYTDSYPRASLSAIDVNELGREAELDSKLFALGLPLSKEEAYDRYNRNPPQNPEDELKKEEQGGGQGQGQEQAGPGGPGGGLFGGPPGGGGGGGPGGGGGGGPGPGGPEEFAEPGAEPEAGHGFTGQRKDKLGRRECFDKGLRVPCQGQGQGPGKEPGPGGQQTAGPFSAADGLGPAEVADFNHRLANVAGAAGAAGLDGAGLAGAIHAGFRQLQHERQADPGQYSPASPEDVLAQVIGENWTRAAEAQRSKEKAIFDKLRDEHLSREVEEPPEAGKSQATVRVVSRRPIEKVEALAKRILGPEATLQDVASLVGAPDNAIVSITPSTESNRLTVRINHPSYKAKRTIGIDYADRKFIHNDEFWMNESEQGKGLGVQVFTKQVENARKLGFSYIDCHAARVNPRNPGHPHNGYYTWPRFGYDMPLEHTFRHVTAAHRDKATAAFPHAKSVLDILLTREGRDWWKKNGWDLFYAKFDLTPGSRSQKVLNAYLAERRQAKPAAPHAEAGPWQEQEIDDVGGGVENFDASPDDWRANARAWQRLGARARARAAGRGARQHLERFCQQGENTGKPGPCPGPQSPHPAPRAPGPASLLARARQLPARILGAAVRKVRGHYKKLEAKYGRGYALAITGAAVAGLPLPGGTLAPLALTAIAALHKRLSGAPAGAPAPAAHAEAVQLTPAQIRALAGQFRAAVLRDFAGSVQRFMELDGFSGKLRRFCGGKGSKRPGPCPSRSGAEHITARAHANAAAHRLGRAEKAHARHGTQTTAQALEAARAEHGRLHGHATHLEGQARTAEAERQKGIRARRSEAMQKVWARSKGAGAKPWEGKSAPDHTTVYNAPTGALHVDPKRFQFKLNLDPRTGVSEELKGIETFNPDFAGVLAAWQDPADGKSYVVNGHHRHELAARTGHPTLPIRYIKADTAEQARAVGALINIAEGRGTAVDAAKFMRDMGVSPEDFGKHGVSLKGNVARDAATLTKLGPQTFHKVAVGLLDPARALAVARHLDDHDSQRELFDLLDKREDAGKETTPKVIEEMAREMANTPKGTRTEETLFGPITSEESLFVPRNELKAHIRGELSREVNDFLAGASKRRAARLGQAGNVLNVEENKRIAQEADRVRNVYDTLVNRKGAIAEALNAAAADYHRARTRGEKDAVREKAFEAVKRAVYEEAGFQGGGAGGGAGGGMGGGPPPPASEPSLFAETPPGQRGRGAHAPAGLNKFCGGKGSRRPGPCPKGAHDQHHVARAHANAAAFRLDQAEARHARRGTQATGEALDRARAEHAGLHATASAAEENAAVLQKPARPDRSRPLPGPMPRGKGRPARPAGPAGKGPGPGHPIAPFRAALVAALRPVIGDQAPAMAARLGLALDNPTLLAELTRRPGSNYKEAKEQAKAIMASMKAHLQAQGITPPKNLGDEKPAQTPEEIEQANRRKAEEWKAGQKKALAEAKDYGEQNYLQPPAPESASAREWQALRLRQELAERQADMGRFETLKKLHDQAEAASLEGRGESDPRIKAWDKEFAKRATKALLKKYRPGWMESKDTPSFKYAYEEARGTTEAVRDRWERGYFRPEADAEHRAAVQAAAADPARDLPHKAVENYLYEPWLPKKYRDRETTQLMLASHDQYMRDYQPFAADMLTRTMAAARASINAVMDGAPPIPAEALAAEKNLQAARVTWLEASHKTNTFLADYKDADGRGYTVPAHKGAEYQKLYEAQQAANNAYTEHSANHRAMMAAHGHTWLAALLPAGGNQQVEITGAPHLTEAGLEQLQKANAFLRKAVGPAWGKPSPSRIVPLTDGDRANHWQDEIRAHAYTDASTLVHEYGHHLDYQHGDSLGTLSRAYAMQRVQEHGEKPAHLGSGYEAQEIGSKNGFGSPYTGKYYDHHSSEVVSMGLQAMYDDPIGFYTRHRDHFRYTLAALHGFLT